MFGLLDFIIVRPIVNILFIIYSLVGDFGIAIIIFTIIVKIALWPLMKRQLRQSQLMKEIQPELKKIKQESKGNRRYESLQTMALYKKKNIKPLQSVLTIFIQLPIFIALFTAINVSVRPCAVDANHSANISICANATPDKPKVYSVEHSAYSFTSKLPGIKELIDQQNDYFKNLKHNKQAKYNFVPKLFGFVDLSQRAGFNSISAILILITALLAALIQYLYTKLMSPVTKSNKSFKTIMREAAAGKEADQAEINNLVMGRMNQFMPIMLLFIMLSLPGAIILYYFLINVINLIQQRTLRNHNYTEKEQKAQRLEVQDAQKINAIEAEVVRGPGYNTKNKKSPNITRISANTKKKRRK